MNPYPFFLQRIFGETAEKNLYLSQLIILDTLEKCLAGVSRLAQAIANLVLKELEGVSQMSVYQLLLVLKLKLF